MKTTTKVGLPLAIHFDIPAYWTPEEALAVYDLLNELRDAILNHYGEPLFELIREQYVPSNAPEAPPIPFDDDIPF